MDKVLLKLNEQESIYLEMEPDSGERRVSLKTYEMSIDEVTGTLSSLSEKIFEPIIKKQTIDLDEVSLELNVGLTVGTGGLTKLIIKSEGSLLFKVTLTWKRNNKDNE